MHSREQTHTHITRGNGAKYVRFTGFGALFGTLKIRLNHGQFTGDLHTQTETRKRRPAAAVTTVDRTRR